MNDISLIEWLGYLASALVLISLSMSSIARLRWFNLAGALCFAVYGAVIEAWPVAVVNTAIAFINVYYLLQLYAKKDYFKLLETRSDNAYLREFLRFHEADISRWYPQFDGKLDDRSLVFLALRNMAVAGVFVGEKTDKKTLKIVVEHVIREYADRKVGRFIYRDCRDEFRQRGIHRLVVDTGIITNENYFRAMGFRESRVYGADQLVLDLDEPRAQSAD